jgi:hypothetical protein
MDKVQEPSNSECCPPSSEPFKTSFNFLCAYESDLFKGSPYSYTNLPSVALTLQAGISARHFGPFLSLEESDIVERSND